MTCARVAVWRVKRGEKGEADRHSGIVVVVVAIVVLLVVAAAAAGGLNDFLLAAIERTQLL